MKYSHTLFYLFTFIAYSLGQSTHMDIYYPEMNEYHSARVQEFFEAFDKNELEVLSQLVKKETRLDTNLIAKYRAKITQPSGGHFGLYKGNGPRNSYQRVYFENKAGKRKRLFSVTLYFDDKNFYTVENVEFERHKKLPKKLKRVLDKFDDNSLSREEKIKILRKELDPPSPIDEAWNYYKIDWEKNKIKFIINNCDLKSHPYLEDYDVINQLGFSVYIEQLRIIDSTDMPTWIQRLENLEYLRIFAVDMKSVPAEIGNLPTKKLTFCVLRVEQAIIPASIGNLEQLEELIISCNDCRELPSTLTNLKKLKKFEFHGNNLDKASVLLVYSMGGQIRRRD